MSTDNFDPDVKLLIEGEEEIGSPNLEPYIAAHKEQLAADAVLGFSFAPDTTVTITVGVASTTTSSPTSTTSSSTTTSSP